MVATTAQGIEYDRVIAAETDAAGARRRSGLPKDALIGISLIALGLVLLLVTWLQIKDIENVAAQIPYIASGGLAGVAAAVIGGIALFARPNAGLAARVEELSAQVTWSADVVERMAAYLNELGAQDESDPAGRSRTGR
jgi:hypothetical protein